MGVINDVVDQWRKGKFANDWNCCKSIQKMSHQKSKAARKSAKNKQNSIFLKIGLRSFLTSQNDGAIFPTASQPTKTNHFATASLMTGFQKRKRSFLKDGIVQQTGTNFIRQEM